MTGIVTWLTIWFCLRLRILALRNEIVHGKANWITKTKSLHHYRPPDLSLLHITNYIIVWNQRQKESCSTNPVFRVTLYMIYHVLSIRQDGCSAQLALEHWANALLFELKLQPHVVGSCTVCPVCTVATLLDGKPCYSPAAPPAFLTKNRPFRSQPVSLFHQPVEHVMLGVGEPPLTLLIQNCS